PSLRPGVKRGALQQFRDQVWVSFDPDEKALPAMVSLLGDDRFVWASDYPHFDATFPGATAELREGIAPLSAESQRRILGENPRRGSTGSGGPHAQQPARRGPAGRLRDGARVERDLPPVLLQTSGDLDVGLEVDDRPARALLEEGRIHHALDDDPVVEPEEH